MTMTILVVNTGSTTTKLGLYRDEQPTVETVIVHEPRSGGIWQDFDERLARVRSWARDQSDAFDAIGAIGGLLRPLEGGTYRVTPQMVADARANLQGEHASNLGCAVAHALAEEFHCSAYVVDPVSVDELEVLARYSGHPLIQRRSLSHALNIHATGRRIARELGRSPENTRMIIAHLGGGISVAPLERGRIIDINDASSDGPFSPERTGGLPLQPFITLCTDGKHTEAELRRMVMGGGGLLAYLGTTSAVEVERRITEGDREAREVFEAMAYQIAKEIGAMATVLRGTVDAIVLTGGLAASAVLTGWIKERVEFLGPVIVSPGQDEMEALALGVRRVLSGEEEAREY